MPRDFRHSYSRSPRRSRTRSPKRDRYNGNNDRYRDDRRGGGDRYDRNRRSNSRDNYGGNGNGRYRNDRNYSRDRSSDGHEEDSIDQCRIHIADLTNSVTQYDIEKSFMKFGEIKEVWMAKNPPCFAFVVYKTKEDAAEAVKEMDQKF
jgi:hypothetical protein